MKHNRKFLKNLWAFYCSFYYLLHFFLLLKVLPATRKKFFASYMYCVYTVATYCTKINRDSKWSTLERLPRCQSPKPCDLWKLISNQFPFCSLSAAFDTIYHQMLFSTLCRWASHELHFADLKLTGRSFKVQSISSGHRGTSKAVLNSVYFFIYTILLGHFIQAHGFSYMLRQHAAKLI